MEKPSSPAKLKILVFAASLRAESLNAKLAALAALCIKRAWVEFLGEPPGMGADRVDPVTA